MTAWSEPPPRPRSSTRRARPRRTWPQRILITIGLISSLTLVASAAGLAWGLQRYKDIQFVDVPNVEPAEAGTPSNWLLVGSDSREGIDPDDPNAGAFLGEVVEGKRTDTIIVARVDPETKTVDLLSVPRDLWVPIAGTGENGRVNAAFNGEGGEERLVSTVEDFLDIEINNYAEINFVGFQAIIDALGGVPIWFDNPVRDPKSGLDVPTAGCHSLAGFEALAFARSRSLEYYDGSQWRADPTGDLGRTARQQFLLTRLATTASSELDLTDLGTVDRILRVGGQNLLIDDGAGAGDLIGLARTFASVGGDGIRRHALPVEGFRTSGGAAVLALLEADAQPTLEVFRGRPAVDPAQVPSEEEVARDSFGITVQNGARIGGLASSTSDTLTAEGFVVVDVTDAPSTVEQTTIRYPSSLAAGASALGRSLTAPPLYELDETLTNVVMVVGPDYVGLGTAAAPAEVANDTTVTTATPETPPTEPPAAPAAPSVGENEVGIVPGPGPAGTPCA